MVMTANVDSSHLTQVTNLWSGSRLYLIEQPLQRRPHPLHVPCLATPSPNHPQRQPDQCPPIRRRPHGPVPQPRGKNHHGAGERPPRHEPTAPVAMVICSLDNHGRARIHSLLRQLDDPGIHIPGSVERAVQQRPQRRLAPPLEPALQVERELVVGVAVLVELNQGRQVRMPVFVLPCQLIAGHSSHI